MDALKPVFATDQASSAHVVDDRAQVLERVASEMGRLRFLQAKGKKLPFVQSLGPRIDACEASLGAAAAKALEEALSAPAPRDRSRIEHCLRAHVAMDRARDAEEAIGRVLVEPAVRRVVDAATAATSFPELLHACVAAAIASCELEVEASGDKEFGMDAKMCVLANSVLAKVDEAVHAARPGEYGPGEPDRFIRNQKAAMAAIRGWRSERRPWRT